MSIKLLCFLLLILNLIMPLLNNLKKNPEKDFVKWPNRTKDIENFIKKLNEYIAS